MKYLLEFSSKEEMDRAVQKINEEITFESIYPYLSTLGSKTWVLPIRVVKAMYDIYLGDAKKLGDLAAMMRNYRNRADVVSLIDRIETVYKHICLDVGGVENFKR